MTDPQFDPAAFARARDAARANPDLIVCQPLYGVWPPWRVPHAPSAGLRVAFSSSGDRVVLGVPSEPGLTVQATTSVTEGVGS